MLLKADAAQLEYRVKVFLAQDKIAMAEILKNEDIHTNNQKDFGLPSRLVAKVFIYRMIFADAFGPQGYEGPAYAYANDPEFESAGLSKKKWVGVIERFFEKYQGIKEHSVNLIRTVAEGGSIISPSGREYTYTQVYKRGQLVWSNTEILNHIVQGLAADFVMMARKYIWRYIPKTPQICLINTVHDDIEVDCDNNYNLITATGELLEFSFKEIPETFRKTFGSEVNVPMSGECKVGWSLHEDAMIPLQEYIDKNGNI